MQKITLVLLVSCLGWCFKGYSQEMGFEEYNPKSTLVVPENPKSKAKFPFIDIHSHQRDMSPSALKKLVFDMDYLN